MMILRLFAFSGAILLFTSSIAVAQSSVSAAVSVGLKKNVHVMSAMPEKFPQKAIKFVGFDGSTYIYRSSCCDDGHLGLIYSDKSLNVGCGTNGVDGSMEMEVNEEGGTGKSDLSICMKDLDSNVTQIQNTNWGTDDPFRDYYGQGRDNTSIRLKAQDGNVRAFTVVKSKINFNGKNFAIPMLLVSRANEGFSRSDAGGGLGININPGRKLNSANPQAVNIADWSKAGVFKINVNLPVGNDDNNTQAVECLMVHRN